ncbi:MULTISPECIES: 1-deoxy-D-xylulose-5-phosphate reductoisomerase [Acidithiobacillus]|jgi:1-deoxy-D-xylulose-5-phosphate reductoisomerase|nr:MULTISPECIES: 1-deoxy-D-xylulose-5-phosphate reductoisomerase [Acidithiobacillus]B5EQQ4.1 RecName: Full=1-deoxy-D-xylulose 5-phosphate reductoisomerase; Short=DXP reductoisomerase; AltName: Full=1-deoxyxylulose-5-phosphate reductoisomerase; AltName: Full=2-C-methyl-D-erythritol 4-phosphate synthase [Acidithiobacillus ferrooxidans ATCC 53993]MCL5956157.1 1-deoxy-D-xylulose-5-phosphate reductoisomerase [Gammaproteobacteria bacterium]ACH83404.1 1-deoxy-D-xylulose 5-phosphate reductoisomerase [Ac
MTRGICILGATGSIGKSTLDVVSRHPDQFRIVALTGNHRVAEMQLLCQQHHPELVVMAAPEAAQQLRVGLGDAGLKKIQVESGPEALAEAARMSGVDEVMAAIVGAAGLLPTLAAVEAGKKVYLANKECLVMAGNLFMERVRQHQVTLLPIDSEHNAVFQCFADGKGVRRILLTASGGPFRTWPAEHLAVVTPDQACAHPNWVMGRKISVDSATMMNKGLEVIEAHWLFDLPASRIDVMIHPQSIIHSMVEYVDGSVLAQLGNPDMRTPIAHALAFPERMESGVSSLDLAHGPDLQFEAPDLQRFPCLALAFDALQAGGAAATVLNAANEIAVQAFLEGHLPFLRIAAVVEDTLGELQPAAPDHLDDVLAIDQLAREVALRHLARHGSGMQ